MKSRYIVIAILLSLGFIAPARADWCTAHTAIPIEEAYEKASLIFYGKLVDMEPVGFPHRIGFDNGSGNVVGAIVDCEPTNEVPYDPKKDCGSSYQSEFEVLQVFKDDRKLVKENKVQVNALNRLYRGFQFEYQNDGYLVYAWNRTQDENEAPWASLCARTRPRMYSSDDLRYFRDVLKFILHNNLEHVLRTQ